MSSLNQYKILFRDTLNVQNATIYMLADELLGTRPSDFDYAKDLVREIARLKRSGQTVSGYLRGRSFWPCHTPAGGHLFRRMGSFYVNDRQDLFDMFSNVFTFLDFEFEASKSIAHLLHDQECDMFLSERVIIETEAHEPRDYNLGLTREFRARAKALAKSVVA